MRRNGCGPFLRIEETGLRNPRICSAIDWTSGATFGGALADALGQVNALQDAVGQKYRALATGAPLELHDLMSAMGKSEVAFNLLLEVKNKLVDAWDKLSRTVG